MNKTSQVWFFFAEFRIVSLPHSIVNLKNRDVCMFPSFIFEGRCPWKV